MSPDMPETEEREAAALPSKDTSLETERSVQAEARAAATTSLEPARSVAQRLGRSVRTIERWVKAGILPPPIQVNGRNLHRAGVMPKPDDT